MQQMNSEFQRNGCQANNNLGKIVSQHIDFPDDSLHLDKMQ